MKQNDNVDYQQRELEMIELSRRASSGDTTVRAQFDSLVHSVDSPLVSHVARDADDTEINDSDSEGGWHAWLVAGCGAVLTAAAVAVSAPLAVTVGLAVVTAHATYYALTQDVSTPGYFNTPEGLTRGVTLGVAAVSAPALGAGWACLLAVGAYILTDDDQTMDVMTKIKSNFTDLQSWLPTALVVGGAAYLMLRRQSRRGAEDSRTYSRVTRSSVRERLRVLNRRYRR